MGTLKIFPEGRRVSHSSPMRLPRPEPDEHLAEFLLASWVVLSVVLAGAIYLQFVS